MKVAWHLKRGQGSQSDLNWAVWGRLILTRKTLHYSPAISASFSRGTLQQWGHKYTLQLKGYVERGVVALMLRHQTIFSYLTEWGESDGSHPPPLTQLRVFLMAFDVTSTKRQWRLWPFQQLPFFLEHQCWWRSHREPYQLLGFSISPVFVGASFAVKIAKVFPTFSSPPGSECALSPSQRLEADLAYWMDHARTNDHGRQHHYDENAPIGPRDHSSYRHGANVNYDYY